MKQQIGQVTLEGSFVPAPHVKISDIHPVIISASRATDIPAFYLEWFFERISEGYILWKNPYNAHQCQKVHFDKTKAVVFWTKDPHSLFKSVDRIDTLSLFWYAQVTLNDYEETGYEVNVPPLELRINAFKMLSGKIGRDRVIWRFDPILLSGRLTLPALLSRITRLYSLLSPYTKRLVFSFIDISKYQGVRRNLQKYDDNIRELSKEEEYEVIRHLQHLNRNGDLEIMACCEKEDYSVYGIEKSRCIDGLLLSDIGRSDPEFVSWLLQNTKKGKGQRPGCGCTESKDIGEYSTCMHLCRYCYANRGSDIVHMRYHLHKRAHEKGIPLPSIVPDDEFFDMDL